MSLYGNQKKQAAIEAGTLIQKGHSPSDMVHVLYLPDTHECTEEEIMGLSTPIDFEDYRKGGYISRYYSLKELVS